MLAERQRGEAAGRLARRTLADRRGDRGIQRAVGEVGERTDHALQRQQPAEIGERHRQREPLPLVAQRMSDCRGIAAIACISVRRGDRAGGVARLDPRDDIGMPADQPAQERRMPPGPRHPVRYRLAGHRFALARRRTLARSGNFAAVARSGGMTLREAYPQPDPGFRRAGMRDLRLPPVHQGVGNALRSIYANAAAEMPAEFTRLLDKLR